MVNLPYEMRWQEVKDIFRKEFGEVAHCNIYLNEFGKSRGCGVVEFVSPDSAKKALQTKSLKINSNDVHVKDFNEGQRDAQGYIIAKKAEGKEKIVVFELWSIS